MIVANGFDLEEELRKPAADVLRALRKIPKDRRAEAIKLAREKLDRTREELAGTEAEIAACNSALEWLSRPFVLEKNDCSRLHRLADAMTSKRILLDDGAHSEDPAILNGLHSIVVAHNWAGAFSGASDYDGEFRLPYERCAFEFRFSGRNVIAIAGEEAADRCMAVLFEFDDYWCSAKRLTPLETLVMSHVKAICVALDAEIATTTVTRASDALNAKRARIGKAPLCDFHTVDLARRHRVANPSTHHDGTRKRLHFRRGHWRHYAEFKTWVRWTLVGDPDLGFVDKQYRI